MIIERQDAKVIPMPFSPRRTPDLEDTKNQQGTPVATEEHVEPREDIKVIQRKKITENRKGCCS